jgi:hypothetical protein
MNSVGSHGSLSLPFVMKVMVCHFVNNSHEIMTILIVVLPIIVVVEFFLQIHEAPFVLGLDVGHSLQLSKILSIFIKRNVLCSFLSSASFLGKDLIISVFVSFCTDGLNFSSILNSFSMLDCLPPFVRKFWSPPLVAWKYVKTSGQEFFSYGALGRFIRAFQVNKIIHFGCAYFHSPNFVDSHHIISANLNILSSPSLIELFFRGTKFKSGFFYMLSIEEAIDKGFKKVCQQARRA